MLCDTPLGNIWTNMDSAEKTLKTGDWEQIKVSPKSNLLKQGVLLVLITGHSGQFQEKKRLLQDSCITKDHPSMGDNSWKLETYSVLPSLQEALLGWRVSFPGSSIDLSLLQAAQLVSASFGQLSLCKNVSQPVLLLICSWWGGGLENLVSFRNFLKTLSSLLPELNEHPCRMECFASSWIILFFHLPLNNLCLEELPWKIKGCNLR